MDHAQRIAHRLGQLFGKRRGLHAAGGAQEQGVVELPAQARQGIAHGGLAQAQVLGHLGDLALGQQLVEDHQQIEIDVLELHGLPR